MKKVIFLLGCILSLFSIQTSHAQLVDGDSFINARIGVGSYYGSGFTTTLPALEGSFEIMVTEAISVGGFIGTYGSKFDFAGTNTELKYHYIHGGALGNYHFVNDETFDVYAGARLGYVNKSTKIESSDIDEDMAEGLADSDTRGSGILVAAHIGGRYHLSESISLNAELGYGISILTIGATFML